MRLPIAIAGILTLEAAIFAAALLPDVDPAYRAFYIERTSSCYELPVSGRYSLGTELLMTDKGSKPAQFALSRCGWRESGRDGMWSDGDRAILRFHVGAAAPALRFNVTILPFIATGLSAQRVSISANGETLLETTLTLTTPTEYELDIPAPLANANDGYLDIRFDLPDAASPDSLGIGRDYYQYGVRLYTLRLDVAQP